MSKIVYSEQFRIESVKQVTNNCYSINDTAKRLVVHPDSLRNWIKRFESPQAIKKYKVLDASNAEIKKIQKEDISFLIILLLMSFKKI